MRIATLRFVGDVHGETIKMELSRNEHVFPGSAGGAVRPPAPPGSALGESTSALRFLASLCRVVSPSYHGLKSIINNCRVVFGSVKSLSSSLRLHRFHPSRPESWNQLNPSHQGLNCWITPQIRPSSPHYPYWKLADELGSGS